MFLFHHGFLTIFLSAEVYFCQLYMRPTSGHDSSTSRFPLDSSPFRLIKTVNHTKSHPIVDYQHWIKNPDQKLLNLFIHNEKKIQKFYRINTNSLLRIFKKMNIIDCGLRIVLVEHKVALNVCSAQLQFKVWKRTNSLKKIPLCKCILNCM